MSKRSIILDCDPGQDDAISLLLALSSPNELEILGITTVAGNVPLELTQRNARLICDIAGRDDVAVFAGCDRPLVRNLVTEERIHGDSGIDGIETSLPQTPLQDQHAVDFIVETLGNSALNSVTLVPTGPLTNIATAFRTDPTIKDKVDEIILMGGAMREGGNHTPSAEFNIFADPHAADCVFQSGIPIVAIGLDVTHQVLSTPERRDKIRALGNRVSDAAVSMLDFFDRYDSEKYGSAGAPLHDPCTVAYLLAPNLFAGKSCNISVETNSELTMGHTAVDFWHVTGKSKNAVWVYDIDSNGFFELLTERMRRYGHDQ